ncbi:MAG: glycosyltransferase, partial [Verrucomicrobiota bacterium]
NYANLKLNIPDSYLNLLTTGTNIQRFKPIQHQEKIALRKRHSIPEESVVIGTVARVSKQKDVATLYKGFVQASQYNSSLVLLHIGAGPLPHQCQALLNDSRGKIIWINSLSPIEEAYQMMDVFALCSLYEGLSLSSIEAMASGLPLILTKVEGNVDILDSGANQCIGVEAQNAHEVMQAMLESVDFLSNTNNHCEVANDQFSDEDFTRRLLSLYESKTNND